jgi:hypothetical protein
MRRNAAAHPIEDVGVKLRGMMSWMKNSRLVERARN